MRNDDRHILRNFSFRIYALSFEEISAMKDRKFTEARFIIRRRLTDEFVVDSYTRCPTKSLPISNMFFVPYLE